MSIEIKGLAPLLQVFDMSVSLQFYRDILGFRLTGNHNQNLAMIAAGLCLISLASIINY